MEERKRKLKCWCNDNDAIVDSTDVAPAPCKDFFHVFVTPEEIVYRLWKIVPPNRMDSSAPPSEVRDTWEDFIYDERLHSELQRVAGHNTLDYLMNLIQGGHVDYLPRLPCNILFKIIFMLDLEDVLRLGQVSRQFRELCNSDQLWERIYRIHSETPVTQELVSLADVQGWKKLFFTNKLQLQMQLRRSRQHNM